MSDFKEIKRLVLLANRLDSYGLYKEADVLDSIIFKSAINEATFGTDQATKRTMQTQVSGAVSAVNNFLSQEIVGQIIDLVLDVAGLIPVLGEGADAAGFLWSVYNVYLSGGQSIQNWIGAFISSIGLLPEAGTWVEMAIKNVFKRIPYAPILKYEEPILRMISGMIAGLKKLTDEQSNLKIFGTNPKLIALQTATDGKVGFTIAKWANIVWNGLNRFYTLAQQIFGLLKRGIDIGLDGSQLAPTMTADQQNSQLSQGSSQQTARPGSTAQAQPNTGYGGGVQMWDAMPTAN